MLCILLNGNHEMHLRYFVSWNFALPYLPSLVAILLIIMVFLFILHCKSPNTLDILTLLVAPLLLLVMRNSKVVSLLLDLAAALYRHFCI